MKRARHQSTIGLLALATLMTGLTPAAIAQPRTSAAALPAQALQQVGSYSAETGYPLKCGICHQNYPYGNWALPDGYVLATRSDGLLELSRLRPNSGVLTVETIDPTTFRVTGRHTINVSGGWKIDDDYLASDGSLYVLTTHSNNDDSDSREVVAVRKYDGELQQVGIARLTSGSVPQGVNYAPATGSPAMTMLGTKLLVSMGRLLYATAGPGEHHEASMAFVVDTSTMAAAATAATYASHSFNQFVATDGSLALFLDHGDAYPRALALDEITGYLTGMPGSCADCEVRRLDILKFRGSLGNNFTGATANGFADGPSGALTTGVADPDQHPLDGAHGNEPSLMPNAYLISTDLTTGTSRFQWLTRNAPTNPKDVVGQPRLVQVGTDSFAILFDQRLGRQQLLEYRLVNSAGDVLASRSWHNVQFGALGEPAVAADRIFWVSPKVESHPGSDYLRGLDVTNPMKPTLLSR